MTADKTTAPEWIDVAFADGFGWSTYAAHDGDKTRFIRADLCASGQQVRALEWDEYSPGCFFGKGVCGDYSIAMSASCFHEGEFRLSGVEGDFSYFDTAESAKAAAQADYERRILAALTPAPQAATPTAQEAVPTCFACEDNPKRPNIPCAVCGAHPPQPSVSVAEAAQVLMNAIHGLDGIAVVNMDSRQKALFLLDRLALRALKGENND